MSTDRAASEEQAPPSRAAATWATLRTRATALRCLLAGLSAWVITVLPILLAPRSGSAARAAALASLAACVAGSQLIAGRPALARVAGLTAFVGLSLVAWLLAAPAVEAIDGFRGLLGALAWAIYAVSWSHPWSLPDTRLPDAPAGSAMGLLPRRRAPRLALAVAAGGTLCALCCMGLAWRVEGDVRAVLAQALAAVAAVALLTASATLAAAMGREERPGPARLPIDGRVARALLLFALVAGAAVAVRLLK